MDATEIEVRTVADLAEAHHGWLIRVHEAINPQIPCRTFVLGRGNGSGVRRWTRPDGQDMVGLVDESDKRPGVVGTERTYQADTPCDLIRQVKKPRRKRGTP
jgi:hypothetical protein